MRANGRLVLTSHERGDFLMACQKPVRDFGTGCQAWMAYGEVRAQEAHLARSSALRLENGNVCSPVDPR